MRADRPVLGAAVFLTAGLSVLFCYGSSGSGINAALPVANSNFYLNLTTTGPAAIGGVILTIIGILFLIWAIVAALVWHWRLLTGQERRRERLAAVPIQPPVAPEQPDQAEPKARASTHGHRRFL